MRIGIIGPIAVGKTTFGKYLARYTNHNFIPEPIVGVPHMERILKEFYQDPKKWAYILQASVVLEFEKIHMSMGNNVVVDSPHSNIIFSDLHYTSGNINDKQLQALRMMASYENHYDVIIVLKATTDTILKRFVKRARELEDGSEEYIVNHANSYYQHLDKVFARAMFRGVKRIFIEVPEYKNDKQFLGEVRRIWTDIQQSLKE